MIIFHMTTRQVWEKAREEGVFEAPSLHFEGFIHCLRARQVEEHANYYYKGIPDMVLLCIDPTKLRWEVRWDIVPRFNDKFPHIYGPIDLGAVIKVLKFDHDDEGFFHHPAGLEVWAEGLGGDSAVLNRKTGPRPPVRIIPPTEQEPAVPATSPFTVPIRDNSVYEPDFVTRLELKNQKPLPVIEDPTQGLRPADPYKNTPATQPGSQSVPSQPISTELGLWLERVGILFWAFFTGLAAALQPGMLANQGQLAGLNQKAIDGITSAGMIALVLCAPLGGFLSDRFGRRKTAAAGTGLILLAILVSWAGSTILLYLTQILFFLGVGFVLPALLACGMELMKKFRRFNLAAGTILALYVLPGVLSQGSSAPYAWVLAFAILSLVIGGGLVLAGHRLGNTDTTPMEVASQNSRVGLFLACGISLMIGGTWAASGLFSSAPSGLTEGLPNFNNLYPILILILALGCGLGGLFADGLQSLFRRWSRGVLAAPAMAVLAAILITIGFSLLMLRSSAFVVVVGLIGIFFGAGLIRPVLVTSAANTQSSESWGLIIGLQIGLLELGRWIYLLLAGIVSNFSISSQGMTWAAICGMLALLGAVVLVMISAVYPQKK